MADIRFVDTTVRDGQQSLWATNMSTAMMLPTLPILDRAGFDAIEVHANSFEKKIVRELGEDPFERLRLAREAAKNTPLRIIRGRYLTAFQVAPQALEDLWYKVMGSYGMDEIRTSDSSHTVARWRDNVALARKYGIKTILNLIFSISPRHTDEYYAQMTREAVKLKPYRICVKDPGALLTPERVRTLVPLVLANAGGIPVEFHTHCNTGLGLLSTLEAIEQGIICVNTAIPPMAEGSSNPSTFDVARNARLRGHQTLLDESELPLVEEHLRMVARSEGFPVGAPLTYDAGHYIHQVPGGMISNLRFQLGNAGLGDRLPTVLEEIGRVRADFGYPIMVTPYSQFMGAQAVMNVLAGERYATVSDEIIDYALGTWGEDERDMMDPDVRDRVLDRPRARELAEQRRQSTDTTLEDLRRRYGGQGVSDEDMMSRIFTDHDTVERMKASGRVRPWSAKSALARLIEKASKHQRLRYVDLRSGGISLRLGGKSGGAFAAAGSDKQGDGMSKFNELSDGEIDKIGQIVEVLDKSNFDFLTLEIEGFRLTVGTGSAAIDAGASVAQPAPSVSAPPQAAPPVKPAAPEPAAQVKTKADAGPIEGTVEIKAPTMGHFYSRPEPSAEPFVSIGATVQPDTTVGLVEVMKLFNGVPAGSAGTVVQICVEDGDIVEFGQVLMRIKPAG
jgi:oxaloacetate decarboxylase alpha subunit